MRHRNIRATALALAVALCLLLMPAAAADYEPWTYEADDLMASYGVEYYDDVGFDDPRAGRTTDSASSQSATGGASTYSSDAGSAVAVQQAEKNATGVGDENYNVVIPAEVEIPQGADTAELDICGTVQPYYTLTVAVSSKDYKLKAAENENYYIDYGVELTDGTNIEVAEDGKACTVEMDDEEKAFSTQIQVALKDKNNAMISSEYTDTLTFEFDCRQQVKSYIVEFYKESKNSTSFAEDKHGSFETKPVTKTLDLLAGSTTIWQLDDLVENGVVDESERGFFEDTEYAIKAPASNKEAIKVYVYRKLVCVDLNGMVLQSDGTYKHNENLVYYGTIKLTVNGTGQHLNRNDYMQMHTLGSTIQVFDAVAKPGYKIVGYCGGTFNEAEIVPYIEGETVEFTLDDGQETSTYKRRYEILVVLEPDDVDGGEDILLPDEEESRPVVAEAPAMDTDADVIDDSADEPETTPDDLMITDADEMIAEMDDNFAMSVLDTPA